MIEAFDILELLCETILARLPLMQLSKYKLEWDKFGWEKGGILYYSYKIEISIFSTARMKHNTHMNEFNN